MHTERVLVGIADMKIERGEGMLVTCALGSCIGVCLYDPLPRLAALLHIMLPNNQQTDWASPLKYADSGIRETLRQMERQGAYRARITAKIAGGAKMFEIPGGGSLGNIGQRNIESVRLVLKAEGIRLLAEDVGGTLARTLLFDVYTGQGCIRSYGRPELIF